MTGRSRTEARIDSDSRGRLVESAVGAHLANAAAGGACELFYWRERGAEVDIVGRVAGRIIAIEVRSTTTAKARSRSQTTGTLSVGARTAPGARELGLLGV